MLERHDSTWAFIGGRVLSSPTIAPGTFLKESNSRELSVTDLYNGGAHSGALLQLPYGAGAGDCLSSHGSDGALLQLPLRCNYGAGASMHEGAEVCV